MIPGDSCSRAASSCSAPGRPEDVDGGGVQAVVVAGGGRGSVGGRVGQSAAGGGRGDLGLVAGEDLLEDVDRGQRVGGGRGDDGVLVAVADGDQVDVVGVAAAGERDVQLLAGFGSGGDGVAGVGGDSLPAVHGGGVAELHVRGDVVGGQALVSAGVGVHDVERPVPVARVTLHRSPFLTQSVALVRSRRSLRRVMTTSPALAAEPSTRVTCGPRRPVEAGEPVGAGADVQPGGQLPGGGQHDAVQARLSVGGPGRVGVLGDRGQVPDVDPVVVDVEPDPGRCRRRGWPGWRRLRPGRGSGSARRG